jgi:hypothetical protein
VLTRELGRVYPIVPLYLRLGDFHLTGAAPPAPRDVLGFVLAQAPAALVARWDALRAQQRLMLFFDGMDEMSRERYGAHVAALSQFASEVDAAGAVRTLFSCRINDFSPEFRHRRMVLLPFEKAQLREFVGLYVPQWPLRLEGRSFSATELTDRLWFGEGPVDPRNPFVLWLLLFYLRARGAWPDNRAALLAFFARRSLERKRADPAVAPALAALRRRPFAALGALAFVLMRRNLGTSASLAELRAELPAIDLASLATLGQRTGLLALSTGAATPQLRFAHHRLGEFFAARHICRARVAIDWLALMDAPRWQETLLNATLMSQHVEPVQQLARQLDDELEPVRAAVDANERRAQRAKARAEAQKKAKAEAAKLGKTSPAAAPEPAAEVEEVQQPLALFTPGQEAALADRVELLARLLRQLPHTADDAMASFESSVSTLLRAGNPSTQVKMLWAWKNLPVADVGAAMAALLTAPVGWVRQQAMLLVADSPEHRTRMRTDTTMLVGLDLARGELLPQLAQHV